MKILQSPIKKSDLIETSTNFIDENAIKAAVDIKRELLAVDSPMHDLIEFDSMINIRPAQNNRSRGVEDPKTQDKIKAVVSKWLI